jgi:TrmH family RNA methyltransferase
MVVVLVEPSLPENVGGVARVMANFGARTLRVVAPSGPVTDERALAVATHGAELLREAVVVATLDEALAGVTEAWAATAMPRHTPRTVLDPRSAGVRLAGAAGEVALVFGPERTGLRAEHVDRCTGLVTVPTHPEARAINLAQAAAVLLWEWRAACDGPAIPDVPAAAPLADQNAFADRVLRAATEAGWLSDPVRRETAAANLRAALLRAGFTPAELRSLHGLLGALARRDGD